MSAQLVRTYNQSWINWQKELINLFACFAYWWTAQPVSITHALKVETIVRLKVLSGWGSNDIKLSGVNMYMRRTHQKVGKNTAGASQLLCTLPPKSCWLSKLPMFLYHLRAGIPDAWWLGWWDSCVYWLAWPLVMLTKDSLYAIVFDNGRTIVITSALLSDIHRQPLWHRIIFHTLYSPQKFPEDGLHHEYMVHRGNSRGVFHNNWTHIWLVSCLFYWNYPICIYRSNCSLVCDRYCLIHY